MAGTLRFCNAWGAGPSVPYAVPPLLIFVLRLRRWVRVELLSII